MNEQPPADKTGNECRRILEQCRKCPATDTLIAFHEDELASGDHETVAAHVGNCPDCAHLLEHLGVAEIPMMEDAAYQAAREEDRAEVAKALGFRVERPPARPLLERFSWLWETRVPALLPAAACALLLLVILWPAPEDSPVTAFGPVVWINSSDLNLRSAPDGTPDYRAPANTLLIVRHDFQKSRPVAGTMVNREISGPDSTRNLGQVSVEKVVTDQKEQLFVEFPLNITKPGRYLLRLNHPGNAFTPVTLSIEIYLE